ncbi:hypothetical protein Acr_00g0014350 [Actinidia rufa]|uniref:Uncharacterized protein n=1 Tax=Actinidia rufa TaxID=165716 RepID=A0A7J0DC08_9ERIC|nr:hypothetical protein Acr_00g0014350 [Actinidia rufa]
MYARLEDNLKASRTSFGNILPKRWHIQKQKKSTKDHERRDEHLKEFVDQEKTKVEKDEVRLNLRFNHDRDETDDALEEDLPLGTIHMIMGPNHHDIENRIRGEIHITKQIHDVLSIQPVEKKPRQGLFKPRSITFNKVDLKLVQHPHSDPFAIQPRVHGYDVKRVLVNSDSLVERLVTQDEMSCLHTAPAMKEVQLVEEERELLEDVGKTLKAKVVEDIIRYELNKPSSRCYFLIGSNMKERQRIELINFLKANIKFFTWTPYEMPKIDPSFIKHVLNVMPEAHLMKRWGRRSTTKHVDTVIKEGKKLNEVGKELSTEPAPKGPEVLKEPPQDVEALMTKNIAEGPEVLKEPPHIDHVKP